jgi:serine/threonine protein kinase
MTMPNDNWQKVREVFDSALRQKPDERRRFVSEVCGDDKTLLAEVESLLSSIDRAESFMETPAVAKVAEMIEVESKKLEAGKRFGHYEIIKQIGVGGMGEVYLASDKKLNRSVAIKILNERLSEDESNLQRFVSEAKAASALNHPNILTIYEFGEAEDARFIVSEYIEGKTLREIVRESRLRLPEILDISIQITGALSAAHKAHLVHRDIKPENIMIRPDGYVKVLDFGLAKLLEQKNKSIISPEDPTVRQNLTAKGQILGTVNYMSPEQAKGESVDERTDIFSLGVLIYEMFAGKPPFGGGNAIEIIASILHKEPVPLSRQTPEVPREIERIINKALRKDREERYQTAKDLLIDLKDVRQDLEFQNKLERTAAPDREEAKTQVLNAATHDLAPHTASSATNEQTSQADKPKANPKWWLFGLLSLIVLTAGFFAYRYFTPTSKQIKSIAVLPFENGGGNADLDYLSDGISEGVIDRLSQFPQLKVISRSSSFKYRGQDLNLQQIAATLGVDAIVTGRVLSRGNSYQIRVDLTDASANKQIWGSNFTREISNIQLLHSDISRDIVENLSLRLSGSQVNNVVELGTNNPQAYEAFAKGRFFLNKAGPDNLKKAIEHFEQAVIFDPNYALAYSYLGFAYAWVVGRDADPEQVRVKSKAAALKAVQLAPNLPDAHFALGRVRFIHWEWAETEREWKRAIELNRNFARAHSEYATFLSMMGRDEESLAEANRAIELDPLDYISAVILLHTYWHMRRYDDAIDAGKKALALDPNFSFTHLMLAGGYMGKGMYKEAVAQYQEGIRVSGGDDPSNEALLGAAYARMGEPAKAEAILAKLRSRSDSVRSTRVNLAVLYDSLGMRDEAFAVLEKAYAERYEHLGYIRAYPEFDALRGDPRFQDLMRRMGLPQYKETKRTAG